MQFSGAYLATMLRKESNILASTLSAQEKQISKIFSNDYTFSIPSYQRPYAWDSMQASDLFDDISGFMVGKGDKVADIPPYFLGSIVLIKTDGSPAADVVDGQQRLTTLTILLSALRENVSSKEAETLTALIYQQGESLLETEDQFRLLLRARDRDFFQDYVQRVGGF